ncbi:MAG: polysaccharide lyase 8 family protein [Lentisphaeria bacterium]|nr:polysaccharide lyase 8 family protein [Lentisphaeria bacterium]
MKKTSKTFLMSPRWNSVLAAILIFTASLPAGAAGNDIGVLKTRYADYLLEARTDVDAVAKHMRTLQGDGAWADIDYTDQTRGAWRTARHLSRIEDMARIYRDSDSAYRGNADVKAAILKALGYWLEHDFTNPNWWSNDIGVPQSILNILILMDGEVPAAMVQRAMNSSLKRSKIGMTGQNKVWLAGNVFLRSLLTGDEKQMKKARDTIFSEVRVTTKEGIQPDWSFHQHGPQQQFGNYGKNFGDSITRWALVFRGTDYALDSGRLAILRDYLLRGPSWIMWKGHFDFSACGRQIGENCQPRKGRETLAQLERMLRIDSANADHYRRIIENNRNETVNIMVGNKQFWSSDMMAHRRPQWYASVKMSSERVIGGEMINSENMNGLHLGDGVLFVYRTALEYDGIQAIWDWHRLPGTTTDQSIKDLTPGRVRCRLPTDFVGGVSDGSNGLAAFDYKRDGLSARKSWFFLDDAIVCLGAGIHADESGSVLTSVQQSLLRGAVVTASGEAKPGAAALQSGDWVHHADIGYLILDGAKTTLRIANQEGSWKKVIGRRPEAPVAGDVFSIWVDHGRAPKNGSYAYAVFPEASAADMARRAANPGFLILRNTPELQAVASAEGVQAVFYVPGELALPNGQTILTDTPCIASVSQSPDGRSVCVAEPTGKKVGLELKIGGETIIVELPVGGDAGKTDQQAITGR